MEIPATKAYEIVGQQQIEIVILREQVRLLQETNQALRAAIQEKSNGETPTAPKTEAKATKAPKGSSPRG